RPADHQPQLGLEAERLQAGEATVEVVLDLDSAVLGELAVEEVVQRVDGLHAVDELGIPLRGASRHVVVIHHGSLPTLAPHRTRTTPSAAPFFHGGAGS